MHILIGTDGSEDTRTTAERAVSLLAPADVVTLMSVGSAPAEESAGLESGFAGGVADPGEVAIAWAAVEAATNRVLERTREAIAPSLPEGARVDLRIEIGAPVRTCAGSQPRSAPTWWRSARAVRAPSTGRCSAR